jgi:sulfide:quinone oxidoreductase
MKKIVIAGSGFGALTAVRSLRKLGLNDPITLVAPKPELFYFPSLIWVPSGHRNESDLTIPLQDFFHEHRVTYRQGRVTGINSSAKRLLTTDGDLDYDYLVIASGGRFIKKLPGIEHAFLPCEGYTACAGIRDRLADMDSGHIAFGFSSNPKEPAAMRGGPMFEFLFGADTLLRQQGRRNQFKLHFFSPAPCPGQRLGGRAVDELLKEMARRGIETHLGHKMKAITGSHVITEGAEIPSDLTLFMPGMTGPAWIEGSGLPKSPGGFITAQRNCSVTGFPGIYVAGDSGSFPGPDWLPKQAHMADLQAEAATRNIAAEIAGESAQHTFTTELICIVDSLDSGVMVFRNMKRTFLFKTSLLHWSKRLFEWLYLLPYRRAG